IAACHYRCLCLPTLPPPTSTLFPYTTLFRSLAAELLHRLGDRLELTLRQRERLGAEEGVLIDRTSTSAPVAREAREQCVGGFDRALGGADPGAVTRELGVFAEAPLDLVRHGAQAVRRHAGLIGDEGVDRVGEAVVVARQHGGQRLVGVLLAVDVDAADER